MHLRFLVFSLIVSLLIQPQFVMEQASVVSPPELQQATAGAAKAPEKNLEYIRTFFSNGRVRAALTSVDIDYQRVDEAVATLSPDDLARVAARSQQIQKDFVVSPLELRAAVSAASKTRQKNLDDIRTFFSSDRVQAALKSVKIDYQRVDTAVATLSPDDLARVAVRTRQIQEDFAAGDDNSDIALALYAALIITIIIVLFWCISKDQYGNAHCH